MFARKLDYYNIGPRPEPVSDGEIKPARFFENLVGISGLSGNYRYTKDDVKKYRNLRSEMFPYIKPTPQKTLSENFQVFAGSEQGFLYHQEIRKLWEDMKDANPVLTQIKIEPDNFERLCDVIAGVISDFNADDINHFISMSYDQLALLPRIAWARGYDFYFPGWQTSPATVASIDTKLEEKGRQERSPFYKFTADHTGKITSGSPDFLLRFV